MRVLVPDDVEPRHLDEVRAVSGDIDVAVLPAVPRRPWERALRFGSGRWLSYGVYRSIRAALDALDRPRTGERAPPAEARGVEVLLATWGLGARALRLTIDGLPELRWIHSTSVGVDRFDLELLRARGIALTAPRGVHARRIAEFVMALVYADAKRLDEHRRSPLRHVRSEELTALRMGIVGYGAVGQAVARLARSNGMQVRAHVRGTARPSPVVGVETSTDLHEVLAASDVVVLALPLTAETRGLLDRAALASMRPTALLVNVGRAATIVERDLVGILREGGIRRAYLDLLDDEDDVPRSHPLLREPRVLYTAHSAASSPRADDEVFAGFLENLRRYRERRPLLGAVALGTGACSSAEEAAR